MTSPKKTSLPLKTNKPLLVALMCALVIVGGFYWYQETSKNQVQPIKSKADGVTPWHWYHTELPFSIGSKNTSAVIYRNSVIESMANWQSSGVFTTTIETPARLASTTTCDFEYFYFKFCSVFHSQFGELGQIGIVYDTDNIIYQAKVQFSDDMLVGQTDFSTKEWRNYVACSLAGEGLHWNVNTLPDPPPLTSCVQGGASPETISAQQTPQSIDYRRLRGFYLGNIDPPLTTKPRMIANYKFDNNLGVKILTSDTRNLEVYEKDLGDGFTQRTVLLFSKIK